MKVYKSRSRSLLFAGLLLLAFVAPLTSWAYHFEKDGLYYNFNGDYAVSVTYKSYDNNRGYNNGWDITEAKIPAEVEYNGTIYSVTSIGYNAFYGCSSLQSLEIPSSVTSIESSTFEGCSSLQSLEIPSSVTSIGIDAFNRCSSLQSLEIPSSVTWIGRHAFYSCNKLESLTFAEGSELETIEASACYGCSSLQSVEIPSSVTSIGASAFWGCHELETLTFAERSVLKTIGGEAFYGCSSLKSFDIPSNVTGIGYQAFRDCSSLQSLDFPSSVTSIGNGAFLSCNKLESLTFAEGSKLETIEAYAFNNCSSLQSLEIPSNVTSIGEYAFSGCHKLETLTFAEGSELKTIEAEAFCSCSLLQSLVIPSSVTSIGVGAFSYCSSLQLLEIPSNMTSIDGAVFLGCSSLQSLEIPSSVTGIGYQAFRDCSSLQSLEIPSSVTSIGNSAFSGCNKLESLTFAEGSELETIEAFAFYGCLSLQSLEIPSSVASIGSSAFYDCIKLSILTFAEGNVLETIGQEAFRNCSSLHSLKIPSSVTNIGISAFYGCGKLEILTFAEGSELKTIESSAFRDCSSLQSLEIPSSVTSIGEYAFSPGIVRVMVKTTTPPALADISIVKSFGIVIVPAESLETYRSADVWKGFALQIAPDNYTFERELNVEAQNSGSGVLEAVGGDDNLTYLLDLKLHGTINSYDIFLIRNRMPHLENLDLTDTRIVANPFEYYAGSHSEDNRLGDNAFRELNLQKIKLPNSINYVGNSAFYHCSYLKDVIMYESVSVIGYSAFQRCSSLKEVTLPEGLVSLGAEAFRLCYDLRKVTFPQSLRTIGSSAFGYCNNLEEAILPPYVTSLAICTFTSCPNLKQVELPAYLRTIESSCFSGCNNIKTIHIPPMVENIGNGAFEHVNLKDVYVYVANPRDLRIDMNTFTCWDKATLHIPDFSYSAYYWDTQWGQFAQKVEFSDTYENFYTKNTLALDEETGVITGNPDALLYENGGLTVDNVEQDLKDVELKSDGTNSASLIATGEGSINVAKLDIVINVKGLKWHFFSFPFDIPLDAITYEGESVWRQYDGAARSRREGGWQNLKAGTTMLEKGRGYIFMGTKDGELRMTVDHPDLTPDDKTTSLFTYDSADAADANWNFVGNPYTSYYNIDETDYSAPITVWTGNGYEAIRPGDDDYEFYPYQAFFVQTPEDADAINFSAEGRDTYESAQASLAAAKARRKAARKDSKRRLINLEVAIEGNEACEDKTRVVINNATSLAYEPACDASKFFGSENAIELYTLDPQGRKYSINERPEGGGQIEMGISVHKAGTFTLSATRMDIRAELYDTLTGSTTDIAEEPYTFTANAGDSKRFVLRLTESVGETTGITDVIVNDDQQIQEPVFDLQGKTLKDASADGVKIKNHRKVIR